MNSFPNEIRLALTLVVNALLLTGCWRFVRRFVSDALDAAGDALLLWYLVQYLVVAGLGVFGELSGGRILVGGAGVGVGLVALGGHYRGRNGGQARRLNEEKKIHVVVQLFAIAIAAYLLAIVWISRYAPPLANDALAYHLSAAVQWLQTGKLGLFHTWYFNPANSYSPLAGSTYIAWLMGPMGNDSLARYVEMPADLLLFFGIVSIARALGASVGKAAVIGFGVAVARPYMSQMILAKDDLPLAAVFVSCLSALSRKRLEDRLGAWRVGAAFGLFFATKYTAMLNAPVLLLAIDAPWRAGWRWGRHLIAIAIIALLAGPWYLRNWMLTGDPIYPAPVSILGIQIFHGALRMLHSARLTSWHGIWDAMILSYYSPPASLAIAALIISSFAIWTARKQIASTPLVRACLLGPPLVIGLFILKSPYGEVRLIGACFALYGPIIALLPGGCISLGVAISMACLSFCTGYEKARLSHLLPLTAVFLAILLAFWLAWRWLTLPGRIALSTLATLTLASWTFIVWPSYLKTCESLAVLSWQQPYGNSADAWDVLRNHTPSGCTIGYDNFFMVYPLFGSDLSRHVVYIPARPGLHEVTDLPFLGPVLGELVPVEVVHAMDEHSDRDTWLANLRRSDAQYLYVGKLDLTWPTNRIRPPVLDFIASAPKHFRPMLSNDSADVYQVNRDASN